MITKAEIKSINPEGNRCVVSMPLFQTASSPWPVLIEALVCITPGFYNNLFVGDIVFVGFEENALEMPIILGKLYTGGNKEKDTPGGAGVLDDLVVRTTAKIPATTTYTYSQADLDAAGGVDSYKHFSSPKSMADYTKAFETYAKSLVTDLNTNLTGFKTLFDWQVSPANVAVDDGDLDAPVEKKTKPAYNPQTIDASKAYPYKD